MKLYDTKELPNPRRVRIFLAEKGIHIPIEQVDVVGGQHHTVEFFKKNPDGTVPLLELDDGTCISETVAISRYFEELHPDEPLMGKNAIEKATVEMWQRRVEHSLMNTMVTYFHHSTDGFGEKERYRNKEWGQHNFEKFNSAISQINAQLKNNKFIAGNSFTIADITTLCAIDLAKALGIKIPAEYVHLNSWYNIVSKRQSAVA